MKKKLAIVGMVIGSLLIAVIAWLLIFPGHMVKSTVNTAGPLALGVDVSLEDAVFRMLRGKAELTGLFIGNPEGFNTPSLCEVGKIRVKLDPESLLSDTLIIEEIFIDSPVFTYQKSVTKSNVSVLLDNLEGDAEPKEEKKDEKKKPAKEDGKKVIIKDFRIEGAMVKLSIKGLPAGAPIPLPAIHMTDIGKESEGASVTEVITKVFGAVLSSITKVATASVALIGKGTTAVAGATVDGATAVAGATMDGATAVGGATIDGAAAVGGATVDGAAAVAGATMDGAAATADAAGKTLKAAGGGVLKATKGITGILKKD